MKVMNVCTGRAHDTYTLISTPSFVVLCVHDNDRYNHVLCPRALSCTYTAHDPTFPTQSVASVVAFFDNLGYSDLVHFRPVSRMADAPGFRNPGAAGSRALYLKRMT